MIASAICMFGCASTGGTAVHRGSWSGAQEGTPDDPVLSSQDLEPGPRTADDGPTAQERILARLSAHEPLYFAVGFQGRDNARFQYSFAYKFLNPEGDLVQRHPWIEGFHFGFSQTSFWDLESSSAPFLDSSYRPGLFWRDQRIEDWSSDSLNTGIELGFEHESNGKDGLESRSVNIAYVKPRLDWAIGDSTHIVVEPKVWAYLDKGDKNPDIAEFRGQFNLRLNAYDEDGLGISSDMRLGKNSDRGYLQVDMTYPMQKLFSGDFEGFLLVQYVNGWGESILGYDRKGPSQIRIGFSLIR